MTYLKENKCGNWNIVKDPLGSISTSGEKCKLKRAGKENCREDGVE